MLADLRGFLTDLPARIPQITVKLQHIALARKVGLDVIAAKAENFAGAVGAYVVNALPAWLSHLFDILTAVFLCIYFMLEGENAYAFFLSLFPVPDRERLDSTLKKAGLKMSKWLFGQGLLMLALGSCSLIVFGFHARALLHPARRADGTTQHHSHRRRRRHDPAGRAWSRRWIRGPRWRACSSSTASMSTWKTPC